MVENAHASGLRPALASVALRGVLLLAVFVGFGSSWAHYLTTSDAGSFVNVARVLAGLAPAGELSLYDTRVFPGWPLLLAPGFALGLPAPSALVLALLCTGLAPWLYARLTADSAGAWLLVAFPPAWLLATVHPISEGAYFCLAVAGCLAVRREAWFLAGLAAGALVLVRPFGIAWVAAFALALPGSPRAARGLVRYLAAGALMALVLAGTNLWLYGDVLHQFRVYARPLAELNMGALARDGAAAQGHWGWPFVHLLRAPFVYSVPLWKVAYVFGTVALFLALAAAALAQLRREPALPAWKRAALAGFLLNTALSFCTGPYWAFHSVDRYLVWGLPGALVAAQPWLARRPRLGWLLAAGSAALVTFSLWNRFAHAD